MTLTVIITPAAELDLLESRQRYESIRPGLAADFVLAVDAVLSRIARHPDAHPVVVHRMRRALLRRFPHAVYYLHEQDAALVVGIIDLRRDPRVWHRRAQ